MNTFSHYVLKKELPVVPVYKGTKRPIGDDWQNKYADLRYITTLLNELDASLKKNEVNIGLLLGEVSGIIALDIDVVRRPETEHHFKTLPQSPCAKIGSKGETRFFRFNPAFFTRKSVVLNSINPSTGNHEQIELLGNGQTVLPPSYLEKEGVFYRWVGTPLYQIDIDELPEIDLSFFDHIRDVKEASKFSLEEIGRNNRLSKICYRMICDEKPVNLIKHELEFEDNKHSVPLFTDHTEHVSVDKFIGSHQKTRARHVAKGVKPPVYQAIEIVDFDPSAITYKYPAEEILSMTGDGSVINKIASFIMQTEVAATPTIALKAAIDICGVMSLGNFVGFNNGTIWPNIWTFLLAPPSGGKGTISTALNQVFGSSLHYKRRLLGQASWQSKVALILPFPDQRFRIDHFDEGRSLFENAERAGSQTFDAMTEACSLWSRNGMPYAGVVAAGRRETGACHSPCVNVSVSIQPEIFAATGKNVLDVGFLNRFIYFQDDLIKKDFSRLDIPGRKWDIVNETLDMHYPSPQFYDGMPKPIGLQFPEKFKNSELASRFDSFAGHGDSLEGLKGRATETTRRLAVVIAASRKVITETNRTVLFDDIECARMIVEASLEVANRNFFRVGSTPLERSVQKCKAFVLAKMKHGEIMPLSVFKRRTGISTEDTVKVLNALRQEGIIDHTSLLTGRVTITKTHP